VRRPDDGAAAWRGVAVGAGRIVSVLIAFIFLDPSYFGKEFAEEGVGHRTSDFLAQLTPLPCLRYCRRTAPSLFSLFSGTEQ
jgi:hypothetical protein